MFGHVKKFSAYVLGMRFMVETDHKSLVALFGSKHLDELPPRILRFQLRMVRFDYTISHVAGRCFLLQTPYLRPLNHLQRETSDMKLKMSI